MSFAIADNLKSQTWRHALARSVIIDTETTGLRLRDEPVEIAVIDFASGEPLFDRLIAPQHTPVSDAARAIHGISDDQLAGQPSFADIAPELQSVLWGRTVLGWNVNFDLTMLLETAKRQRCATTWMKTLRPFCAKTAYVREVGGWRSADDFDWISLADAADSAGVDWRGRARHRALADCQLTRALVMTRWINTTKTQPATQPTTQPATRGQQ